LALASIFGMFVRRYMHKFGVTSRDFGWVAVTLRYHGSRNPRAFQRKPITIDDHQKSRFIAEPLRLLDCCQENDGAAAIVTDIGDRDAIAGVRRRYFQGAYPASPLVEVAALAAPNLKVEIAAIAAL